VRTADDERQGLEWFDIERPSLLGRLERSLVDLSIQPVVKRIAIPTTLEEYQERTIWR
jgi:hypothetical protein